MVALESLLAEVADCRFCEPNLPLGPNPVLQLLGNCQNPDRRAGTRQQGS